MQVFYEQRADLRPIPCHKRPFRAGAAVRRRTALGRRVDRSRSEWVLTKG